MQVNKPWWARKKPFLAATIRVMPWFSDIRVSYSNANDYLYSLDLNLETGTITWSYSQNCGRKEYLPPQQGGDAVSYTRHLAKMIELVRAAQDGKYEGAAYDRQCQELKPALDILEKIMADTRPKGLLDSVIQQLNKNDFKEKL